MAARILIVDDHPLTREALSSLLLAHGFDVLGSASDGAEAIVEAGRLGPDVVLLDLSMPGMDGLTALPRIREAAPECEVVVLTASGTEENLLAAIRAGAAGYLLKTEPPERIASLWGMVTLNPLMPNHSRSLSERRSVPSGIQRGIRTLFKPTWRNDAL
jgi:DNA-binding NarL/FixJ family response regulator